MSTQKRPNRPRDFNQLAHEVFLESIGERQVVIPITQPIEPIEEPAKNPHAVALSKLGASKGGKARTSKMTPEERSELAKKAAAARWAKKSV